MDIKQAKRKLTQTITAINNEKIVLEQTIKKTVGAKKLEKEANNNLEKVKEEIKKLNKEKSLISDGKDNAKLILSDYNKKVKEIEKEIVKLNKDKEKV